MPRVCRRLRKRQYSNAPINVNPARGRGRGNDGQGFHAQHNGSIRAFDCGPDAAPRTGAISVVVIHQLL